MANEAVIIELLGHQKGRPIRLNVLDTLAIPKGSLMTIAASGTRVATITTGDCEFFGIAAHEKVKSDGSTTMSVYTHGIFDLTNANLATFAAGDHLDTNGVNIVTISDAAGVLKPGFMLALEDAAKNEVAAVLVGSGL